MSTLETENLFCAYNGETVLYDINLRIEPGRFICLLGPNGSGKTTLMRAFCRIIKPVKGVVKLDRRSIQEYHAREVAQKIALVSQSNRLAWPFTVHQIVNMGRFPHRGWVSPLSHEDHSKVEEAIRVTGLWEHRNRIIHTLSGGEAQRAMIARALAQSPRILLLDEPVAHLDLKYKVAVLDLVKKLAVEGLGVVVSLHDLNLAAMYADTMVLLSRGRVYAVGGPSTILTKKNLEAVYETEVVIKENPENGKPLISPVSRWKVSPLKLNMPQ